jgi:hypothetical protein
MKNRDTKKKNDSVAERATGRVGAFPYHRAAGAVERENKSKAALAPKIITPSSVTGKN